MARTTDGMALAARVEAGSAHLDRIAPGATPTRRRSLETELRGLVEAVDALGDALTAEGVHQMVRGNPARAAATVDALAHGEIPPPSELQVTATPRPGTTLAHRLVVLFSGAAGEPDVSAPGRARAAADPAVEGWLRQMLGNLDRVRYGAQIVDVDGRVLQERVGLRLGALGVGHMDVLYLAAVPRPGARSDLELLLEHRVARDAPANTPAAATVRLLLDRAPGLAGELLGLGEFLELLRAFREVVTTAGAVENRHLAVDATGADVDAGVDAGELRRRADAALATVTDAAAALAMAHAAAAEGAPDALDLLRRRLVDMALLGVANAIPGSARVPDRPSLLALARVSNDHGFVALIMIVRLVDRWP